MEHHGKVTLGSVLSATTEPWAQYIADRQRPLSGIALFVAWTLEVAVLVGHWPYITGHVSATLLSAGVLIAMDIAFIRMSLGFYRDRHMVGARSASVCIVAGLACTVSLPLMYTSVETLTFWNVLPLGFAFVTLGACILQDKTR